MAVRRSIAFVWLAISALSVATGCERKAPGPSECVALADLALGRPAPQTLHDELVRQCLTTPFDARMMACVERSSAYLACRRDLELRRRRGEDR